jgi:hypothetical protein
VIRAQGGALLCRPGVGGGCLRSWRREPGARDGLAEAARSISSARPMIFALALVAQAHHVSEAKSARCAS